MLCDSFFVVIERMQNGKIPLYQPVSLFIHSYVTSTATTRTFLHFMINAEMYNLDVFVTNDWSEARVDPLAALLIQRGGQTGKYQIVVSRAT